MTLMNYKDKVMILMVDVANYISPASNQFREQSNVLYYVGPYSNFHVENNPVLVVHDHLKGIYILNLKEKREAMLSKSTETK